MVKKIFFTRFAVHQVFNLRTNGRVVSLTAQVVEGATMRHFGRDEVYAHRKEFQFVAVDEMDFDSPSRLRCFVLPVRAATMMMKIAAALVLTLVASAMDLPPRLPEGFYGDFIEYDAPLAGTPPYPNGVPPPPFKATRGKMFYDWSRQAMIEVRYDYCVNIFPWSNDFSCIFFNVNGTSYLMSNGTTNLPPCCIFGQPWHPPPPNFLRGNLSAEFAGREQWDCEPMKWYIVPSILPPTGPFLYTYREGQDHGDDKQVYHSFSFPGMQGWVQQNFVNVTYAKPPASTWDLPDICKPEHSGTIPNCGFFGDSKKMPAGGADVPPHVGGGLRSAFMKMRK